AGAEEDEALVLRKDRLVIVALRVDPELEQAARAMERARHFSLARELARVADVDEHHVRAAVQLDRVGGRKRLDLALGGRDERVHMDRNVLRHDDSPTMARPLLHRAAATKSGAANW